MFDYVHGHIKCRVYTIEAFGMEFSWNCFLAKPTITYFTPKCCYINNFLEVYKLNQFTKHT